MGYIDKRPVYENKNVAKSFENALYFFANFPGDCAICISFHVDPRILPCGHSFCKSCLDRSIAYSKYCPVCINYFYMSKPVRFFFIEEIKNEILFKKIEISKINSENTSDFFVFPYSLYYYDQSNTEKDIVFETKRDNSCSEDFLSVSSKDLKGMKNLSIKPRTENKSCAEKLSFFYQSEDGQLYFLDPSYYRNFKNPPEYIFGIIKSQKKITANKDKHPELKHITSDVVITIVSLK